MSWLILVVVIVLVVLIGGFCLFWVKKRTKSEQIRRVENAFKKVCTELDLTPDYTLQESTTTSWADNKRDIYLVVYNKKKGVYFDDNTILNAAFHELAHVICPDTENNGHTKNFDQIENKLLRTAERLGLVDRSRETDEDYPCAQ